MNEISLNVDEVGKVNLNSLPHIPSGKRIIPNDLIRSSLFTVVNHKLKREYIKEKL